MSNDLPAPQIATASRGGARQTQENDEYKLVRHCVLQFKNTDLRYFTCNNCLILREEPAIYKYNYFKVENKK